MRKSRVWPSLAMVWMLLKGTQAGTCLTGTMPVSTSEDRSWRNLLTPWQYINKVGSWHHPFPYDDHHSLQFSNKLDRCKKKIYVGQVKHATFIDSGLVIGTPYVMDNIKRPEALILDSINLKDLVVICITYSRS